MKLISLFLFLTLSNLVSYSQLDPVKKFNAHKFPCDSGSTTVESNICSGVKLDYANKLLNDTYHKILKAIDKEISVNQKDLKLKQSQKADSLKNKDDIRFLLNDISYNQRLKTSIIQSQKEWIKLRDLNSAVVSITCEGGHECISIDNLAEIDDVLERIKKLQSFYDL